MPIRVGTSGTVVTDTTTDAGVTNNAGVAKPTSVTPNPVGDPLHVSVADRGNVFFTDQRPVLVRLLAAGWHPQMSPTDRLREGTFTIPGNPSFSVTVKDVANQVKALGGLNAALMGDVAFHPRSGNGVQPGVTRVFIPGLNTPEPEASRRTQYYVDRLGLSMAHLHNGTSLTEEVLRPSRGFLDAWVPANKRDWLDAMMIRRGKRDSPLGNKVADLLEAAYADPKAGLLDMAWYSDATIAGQRGMETFKQRMVAKGKSLEEVEKWLKAHVLVELHGNACTHLPVGPRYLVWTDRNDPLTTKPEGNHHTGVDGRCPDKHNRDAVYVDYEGPLSKAGDFESHNLAAGGIHVVAEILKRNGVTTPEQLWEKAQQGPLKIPAKGDVAPDLRERWLKD